VHHISLLSWGVFFPLQLEPKQYRQAAPSASMAELITWSSPHIEHARLRHLKWDPIYLKEKPYQVFVNVPDGERSTNLVFETIEKDVADIRGQEQEYSLKDNGFRYINSPSKLNGADFDRQEEIERVYLSECEELIKSHVAGADQTFIFDWRVRDLLRRLLLSQ
jgi:hypothetical protein